ncbi:MAG: ureidoglycolate lyase, partial [Sporomusa sp.]|nr:ureidoglycolate lyase [Sporomusa sp.]
MKFATYLHDSHECVGVLSNCRTAIYSVSDFGIKYKSMIDLIENITEKERQHLAKQLDAPKYAGLPVDDVELLAPIPKPRDIIAVSQNYVTHVMETCRLNGVEYIRPKYCCYFWRRVNRAVSHNGNICLHAGITSMLDYEVELAVVIGKECSRVAEKDA